MIADMVEAEIRWTTYATKDVPMFTPESIEILVKGQANTICKYTGMSYMYPEMLEKDNPLLELVMSHITAADGYTNNDNAVKRRTAFFEGNVADYAKNNFVDDL